MCSVVMFEVSVFWGDVQPIATFEGERLSFFSPECPHSFYSGFRPFAPLVCEGRISV